MRLFMKFFVVFIMVVTPTFFVGCGPTQVSDEEAAKTAAPEEDDLDDADEPEDADGGEGDGDGDGE